MLYGEDNHGYIDVFSPDSFAATLAACPAAFHRKSYSHPHTDIIHLHTLFGNGRAAADGNQTAIRPQNIFSR